MIYPTKRFSRYAALAGVAAVALMPRVVFAQSGTEPANAAAAAEDQEVANADIIVTGTLIRGIAPAGANVLATSQADIAATGASTVNQLLESIPQLGAFNTVQQPLANSPEVAVNRPNLRSLPGFNTAGGSTTLVLMDGHRMVGMGITSTTPDPDVIPPGVIQRLEIVPDGGSAVYGSDAVSGVLNFITIDRFSGLKVDGSYGFGDDYYQWSGNVTGGVDWGSGSLFGSYAVSKNDSLLGSDRDYIKEFPAANGYRSLECEPGNIEGLAGGLGLPVGTVAGVNGGPVNDCDSSDFATLTPASERHSLFAGLTQELSSRLQVKIRGYYSNRKTEINSGPYRFSRILFPSFLANAGIPGLVSPFNPFAFAGFQGGRPVFRPASANGIDLVENVSFQFGPNDALKTNIELDTWGLSSEFTYDLGGSFRARFLGNYGQSDTSLVSNKVNEVALDNAITAGLFNPFNPTASDPAAMAIITNFNDYARTRQQFTNFRAIVDGDLFDMGAGAVKIAFGLEYYREGYDSRRGLGVPGAEFTGAPAQFVGAKLVSPAIAAIPRFNIARDVKSAFGEIVAPLWQNDGGVELTVSASGRYDSYSDVGDTFNPRFGVTFKPVDWVALRGAWGQSFNAPSLADNEAADVNTLIVLSGQAARFFQPPAALTVANGGPFPNYNGGLIVALRGNSPGIKPQEAETWTVGVDIDPPFIPGLRLSATYYNISYNNFIGLAPFETGSQIYNDFGFVIDTTPTQAELQSFIDAADVIRGTPTTNPSQVYAIIDARKRNFGGFKLDGIDFQVNYNLPTGFGAIFFNSNGTYELSRKQQSVPGATFDDVLSFDRNRFRARTTFGAQVGPVLGQVSWNYSQGYDLANPTGFVPQTSVAAFNTFDLFFKLDVPGEGVARDLSLTMNVRNAFDQDPPEYRGNIAVLGQQGVANGLTIGRIVQFGLSKKF